MWIALFGPAPALACGGFFCNPAAPVLQAAERIVFAIDRDAGEVEMHVQITYTGPSEDFAWIVPVPRAPEIGLSTSAHAGQSRKNWHASTGMVTVLRCPQLGQVSWQFSFMTALVGNLGAILARRCSGGGRSIRMAGVPADRDWPTLAPCVPPPPLACTCC